MAVNGRINVDVLFQDTDGTTSLKVVSLEDSQEYSSGKVAIVTGTCGTATAAISLTPTSYKNASGDFVTFLTVSRVAMQASREVELVIGDVVCRSSGSVSVSEPPGDLLILGPSEATLQPNYTAGTASYTLVLYGT